MDPGKSNGPVATRAATDNLHLRRRVPHDPDKAAYERGFLDGWRDRAEYARRAGLSFDDGVEAGFAAGVRAADRAMRNAIADATGGMPANAADVVHQLLRRWEVNDLRAAADRSGRRPGDYPGREAA